MTEVSASTGTLRKHASVSMSRLCSDVRRRSELSLGKNFGASRPPRQQPRGRQHAGTQPDHAADEADDPAGFRRQIHDDERRRHRRDRVTRQQDNGNEGERAGLLRARLKQRPHEVFAEYHEGQADQRHHEEDEERGFDPLVGGRFHVTSIASCSLGFLPGEPGDELDRVEIRSLADHHRVAGGTLDAEF